MATKKKNAKRTRTKETSTKRGGLVESAVAATVELGHAAESLQDSLSHVRNARSKGRAVTKKVGRTASRAKKKVVEVARSVMKRPKKAGTKRARTRTKQSRSR